MNAPYQSCVRYSDYLVLTVSADSAFTRTCAADVEAAPAEFGNRCFKYAEGIEQNFQSLLKANKVAGVAEGSISGESLDEAFFNVVTYHPVSGPDDTYLVLLDDHDAASRLSLGFKQRVEDIGMGYGVEVESLGIEDTRASNLLCNLDSLLKSRRTTGKTSSGTLIKPFQEEMPLMMISRLRMDSLCALGHALPCQHGLFRAIGTEICRVAGQLEAMLANKTGTSGELISPEDMKAVKCAILDIQRTEEIAVVIFCRNFSVAGAIMARIRALRYSDLFDASKVVGELFDDPSRSPLHSFLATGKLPTEAFKDNHVFRWTRSVLYVSPQVRNADPPISCGGYVEAILEAQVPPGHEFQLAECLKHSVLRYGAVSKLDYNRFCVGQCDLYLPYGQVPGDCQDARHCIAPLVPTAEFLTEFHKLRRKFTAVDTSDGNVVQARDVIDIDHKVVIPIPSDILAPFCRHNSILSARLQVLVAELRKEEKAIEFSDLRAEGVPELLARSVVCLFEQYYSILSDPLLFDLVLDLDDAIATLKDSLFDKRPDPLSISQTEGLADIVEAIGNSISFRLAKALPENFTWEPNITFRGGLNQALLAASAPGVCALGLVRKYAGMASAGRSHVGVVTTIGCAPGVTAHSVVLSGDQQRSLGYFHVDAAHILHVASYADYIHEASHLVFLTKCRVENGTWIPQIANPRLADHVEEIFAMLLTHLIIFGNERDGAFCHYVGSYSRSCSSIGKDETDSLVRYCSVMLRLYNVYAMLPSDAAAGAPKNPGRCPVPADFHHAGADGSSQSVLAWEDFWKFVCEFGPFFREHERYSGVGDGYMNMIRAMHEADMQEISKYLPKIRQGVADVYAAYVKGTVIPQRVDSGLPEAEDIEKAVHTSLEGGCPVFRSLIKSSVPPRSENADVGGPEDVCLDTLYFVGALLRNYILTITDAKGKHTHLYRNPSTGEVEYPLRSGADGAKEWFRAQSESGRTGMFSPVPNVRSRRVRRQMLVMKMCWDVSSALRARRLLALLRRVPLKSSGLS